MESSTPPSEVPSSPLILRCPGCGARLVLEFPQPGARLSDPVAHALIDHLMLIETEMAQIRRVLVEEVIP